MLQQTEVLIARLQWDIRSFLLFLREISRKLPGSHWCANSCWTSAQLRAWDLSRDFLDVPNLPCMNYRAPTC